MDAQTPASGQLATHCIPSLPIFLEAKKHAENTPDKIAVDDASKGQRFTYGQLLADAATMKKVILEELGLADTGSLEEGRIAFLTPNGYDYVVVQWAVWAAGGVCVPLCMYQTRSIAELKQYG
jgi:acyl-CoA synthetase (AMP-forming)/AMP-acid ligase II